MRECFLSLSLVQPPALASATAVAVLFVFFFCFLLSVFNWNRSFGLKADIKLKNTPKVLCIEFENFSSVDKIIWYTNCSNN